MNRRRLTICACLVLAPMACAQVSKEEKKSGAEAAVTASGSIDHSQFDALLKHIVKGDRVDYAGLVGDPRLTQYVQSIGSTHPDALPSKDARLAFYINAYNALTLHSVLSHWPQIKSVSNIKPDFTFFKEEIHIIGGKKVSLDAIENDIIRPTFKEPRIHAALNCASISCPPLAPFAFTAEALDTQLDQVFTAFANDQARNAVDPASGALQLSQILKWYQADFAPEGAAKYLSRFVDNPARKAALEAAKSVSFLPYDWALNSL